MNKITNSHKANVGSAIVVITTAFLAMAAIAPLVSGGVTSEPETVKGDTNVLVTFTVTNDSNENIENVLIRPLNNRFTDAIGGERSAENLLMAVENIENTMTPLQRAGENLKDAAENMRSTGVDFIAFADNISAPTIDDWILEGAVQPNAKNIKKNALDVAADFTKIGKAADNDTVDTAYVDYYVNSAENSLRRMAGEGTPGENMDNILPAMSDDLIAAADNLDSENYMTAGKLIKNIGDNLNSSYAGADIKAAGLALQNVADKMVAMNNDMTEAEMNLDQVSDLLDDTGGAANWIKSADSDDLALAGENVNLAADALSSSPHPELNSAAFRLDNAASELGKVLGAKELRDASDDFEDAGDNLVDPMQNLTTAGNKLIAAASDMDAWASTISTTANTLAPESWTMVERDNEDVVFSATGGSENMIQPGDTEEFNFIWNSGSKTEDFEIWGYAEDGDVVSSVFPVTTTIEVDTVKPAIVSAVVSQENAPMDDLAKAGDATLTVEASEELENLGPIWLKDNDGTDNLAPPIMWSDLDSTDNTTFTTTIDVGTWDDNSPVGVWIESAMDVFQNENDSVGRVDNFYVDTRAPVASDNGIPDFLANNFMKRVRVGGENWIYVDNDGTSMNITGTIEDNWEGSRLGMGNGVDSNGVVTVKVNGEVTSYKPNGDFTMNLTLPEGITSDLTVTATDWLGHSIENSVGRELLTDTALPDITMDSINGESWDENDMKLAYDENTIDVSLTFADSGMGIPYDLMGVWLDNDKNYKNGGIASLDNSTSWNWDPATGEQTFENMYDNNGSGLAEGTYWINAVASDNLKHDGMENAVVSKSFVVDIDITAPTEAAVTNTVANTDIVNPNTGVSFNTPTNRSSWEIHGTASEKNATVKVYSDGEEIASAEVEDDKDFELTVDLDEGRNDLMLQEIDEFGNESENVDLDTIYVDTVAPEVTINEPTAETTDETSIYFEATVTDGVTSAEDITGTVSVTGAEGSDLHVSPTDTVTNTLPLREGQNQITVYAGDEAGNSTTKSVTIERTVPEAANWAMYAMFAAIVAIILAALAVLRRSV